MDVFDLLKLREILKEEIPLDPAVEIPEPLKTWIRMCEQAITNRIGNMY